MIDWILDNLIDKNRTRRAVIKKLKELGLIFKAPTRKSVASAVNKHLWKHEEDKLLTELYDKHRLDDGMCLCVCVPIFVNKDFHFEYLMGWGEGFIPLFLEFPFQF